ncbi:MAG: universal stress protein [Betaproteobacteria bacterium]|jgi:nucleotide-binding universal stress UspA family protein|nr:universal stress protein [Betaproteobacteria bacterium]
MRILLPIDGSPGAHRAVRHVVNRAKRDAALEVELVGLEWPSLPEGLGAVLPSVRLGDSPASSRERDARAMLAMHRIPFRMHRIVGDPACAISEIALRRQCTEIVMGRLGSNGLMRRVLHSLPDRIANMAWRRVTVVD